MQKTLQHIGNQRLQDYLDEYYHLKFISLVLENVGIQRVEDYLDKKIHLKFVLKILNKMLEFKGQMTIWINRSIYANLLRWAGRRSLGL